MDNVRYNKIAKIIGIVIGIALVLSISYAVYKRTTRGQNGTTIEAGRLDLRIDNEIDEITMNNAAPMTDKKGMKTTPYQFDVVNDGTITAMYKLYLEVDKESTIPLNRVKYYLTRIDNNGEEKAINKYSSRVSDNEVEVLENGNKRANIDIDYEIEGQTSNNYKLYLWIDESATLEEVEGKNFFAKVTIKGSQVYDEKKRVLIKRIDVSKKEDGSAYAYFYDDYEVEIKGTGEIRDNLIDDFSFTYTYLIDNDAPINMLKRVFSVMGYTLPSSVKTKDDIETWKESLSMEDRNNINENFDMSMVVITYMDVLKEMGYEGTENIKDVNTLLDFLKEIGYLDENENVVSNKETENIQNMLEIKYNEYSNILNTSTTIEKQYIPNKIIIEEGITNVPKGLYTGNEDIEEVVLPNSIVSIDDEAFESCRNLRKINFPSKLKVIGKMAFYACTSLDNLSLNDGLDVIGSYAFSCDTFKNLYLPDSISDLKDSAFAWCSNLESINIPKNVNIINYDTFYNCENLKNVIFNSNLRIIDDSAFTGCKSLTEITLPDNVVKISNYAFSNCSSLNTFNCNKNLEYIGNKAFRKCTSLENVNLSKNLKTVKNNVFESCSSLIEISFFNKLESFGTAVFDECTNIKRVEFSSKNTNFDTEAFKGCESLTRVDYNGTLSDWCGLNFIDMYSNPVYYSHKLYINGRLLIGDIDLKGVTRINDYVFAGCEDILAVELPYGLEKLGTGAFYGCTNLNYIKYAYNIDDVGDKVFYECSDILTVEVLDGVTKLKSGILSDSSIKKLIINGTIDSSDDYNFSANPKELVLTGNGDIGTIIQRIRGSNLETLIIGDGITSISKNAFTNCAKLSNISIGNSVKTIGASTFSNCDSLEEVYLSDGITDIYGSAFANCDNLKKIHLPNSLTTISGSICEDCKSLEEIVIPKNVETINSWAFHGCTSLEEVSIPDGVTYIDNDVFSECSSLKTIEIPDTVTWLGGRIFDGCTSLETVKLSKNITAIFAAAFRNCSSLNSIEIPDSVTAIWYYAFQYCTSLETIIIPNSVRTMGDNVFTNWTSNQTIKVDNTQAVISSYINRSWNTDWLKNCDAVIEYLRN